MSSSLSQLLTNNPTTGANLKKEDGLYLYRASAAGSAKSSAILASELVQALRKSAAQNNAAGNSTVTVHELCLQHVEVITFSGAGSTTRKVVLAIPAGLSSGVRCLVRCELPATADITVEFRNSAVGGTLITSLVTDGSGDDAVLEFHFDGAAWQFLRATIPANA